MTLVPTIYISIPVLNEVENLNDTIACIRNQNYKNYKLYICVNQPDEWWQNPDKKHICENNHATLNYLGKIKDIPIILIDKSSPGKGWQGKQGGAGWARKVIMDEINRQAKSEDILVSLDADTIFNPGYFRSLLVSFQKNPDIAAITVPYYHLLTEDETVDRALLRYEIYLRYYAINMLRINSPYAFTALGSAIALPVKTYRAVRGISPKKSGEDFYFLQKLRKYGNVLLWNDEQVFPSARPSDRVDFGTGPALIKGMKGDWKSYPIYNYRLFNLVEETSKLFTEMFLQDVETPMTNFLRELFGTADLWRPLRKNFRDLEHFVKACHEKVDGLRILQFLKSEQKKTTTTDEISLQEFLIKFYKKRELEIAGIDTVNLSFCLNSLLELDRLRNFLAEKENDMRKKIAYISID
jgi:glycosyltransferase involved in cell wall biosynthesis